MDKMDEILCLLSEIKSGLFVLQTALENEEVFPNGAGAVGMIACHRGQLNEVYRLVKMMTGTAEPLTS